MTHKTLISMLAGVWFTMLVGCATSQPTTEQKDAEPAFVACEEPRPEICTMHYDPVCGKLTDSGSKTYSNACVACSDRLVIGHLKGECAAKGQPEATR